MLAGPVRRIDIDNIRLTLEYVRDDLQPLPAFAGVTAGLEAALAEIERLAGAESVPRPPSVLPRNQRTAG